MVVVAVVESLVEVKILAWVSLVIVVVVVVVVVAVVINLVMVVLVLVIKSDSDALCKPASISFRLFRTLARDFLMFRKGSGECSISIVPRFGQQ